MNRKILSAAATALCFLLLLTSCEPSAPAVETSATAEEITAEITVETTGGGADETETPTEEATEEETEDKGVTVAYREVTNPILKDAFDPWVTAHNGRYYYCYIKGNRVCVSNASALQRINQNGSVVYDPPAGTAYSYNYWAPELYYIDGEWYIYVAADNGNNQTHRMYVLKGTTQDPTDPFEMVGQITDPTNRWAIDGTILQHNGEMYFIWSGWKGTSDGAQNLYIAHMSDPCTIDSRRVCISVPEYSWECFEWPDVNEGPVVLQHGGKTFVVYSASGSWSDYYCLGMLTLTGDNPMNPDHWEKSEKPVFQLREGVCYGPGHCSFTTAVDGSVWMVYHGNLVSGSGWDGRDVWIAPVTFDENGNPDFGQPESKVLFPVGVR